MNLRCLFKFKQMKKILNFLSKLTSGETNEVSSRRVVALVCLVVFVTMCIASLFNVHIDKTSISLVAGLICTSLGMTLVK